MIYFIQEKGLFRSRVKIGFTTNLKGRLSGLRSGSPSELKVVMVLPGDTDMENVYHEQFTQYRLHGEWFRFGLRLRFFVWLNQYKSTMLDEINEPDEADKLIQVLNEEQAEQLAYEKGVIRVFEALIDGPDKEKLSWRKVTLTCFEGDHSYGPHYTNKLKAILDRHEVDHNFLG